MLLLLLLQLLTTSTTVSSLASYKFLVANRPSAGENVRADCKLLGLQKKSFGLPTALEATSSRFLLHGRKPEMKKYKNIARIAKIAFQNPSLQLFFFRKSITANFSEVWPVVVACASPTCSLQKQMRKNIGEFICLSSTKAEADKESQILICNRVRAD